MRDAVPAKQVPQQKLVLWNTRKDSGERTMAITLNFACNDPDNGNFTGRFDRMEVDGGDLHMEFECGCHPSQGVRIRFEEVAKIGRKKIQYLQYKNWYGNWCWDAIWVRWPEALEVINYVGTLKHWRMVDGPSSLFEAFNDRHVITPQEWRAENESAKVQNLESA